MMNWDELYYVSLIYIFFFCKSLDEIESLINKISKIRNFKYHSRYSRKEIFSQIRKSQKDKSFKIPKILLAGTVDSKNEIIYSINCKVPLILDKGLPRLRKSLYFFQKPSVIHPFRLVVESRFLKINNIEFQIDLDHNVDLRYALRAQGSTKIYESKNFFKLIYVSIASFFGINISFGLSEKVLQIRAGDKLFAMGDLIYNAEKKIIEMKMKKLFSCDPEIYLNRLTYKLFLSILKLALYLGITVGTMVWLIRNIFLKEQKIMINDINQYENRYAYLKEKKSLKCDICKINMKDIMMGECGHIVSCNNCWKEKEGLCKICGKRENGKIRLFPV